MVSHQNLLHLHVDRQTIRFLPSTVDVGSNFNREINEMLTVTCQVRNLFTVKSKRLARIGLSAKNPIRSG